MVVVHGHIAYQHMFPVVSAVDALDLQNIYNTPLARTFGFDRPGLDQPIHELEYEIMAV